MLRRCSNRTKTERALERAHLLPKKDYKIMDRIIIKLALKSEVTTTLMSLEQGAKKDPVKK